MNIFLAIIVGVSSLLFLITIHEFGHFIIAKISGAYVYEFSIGIGPKIYQWGQKETKYTIRLLPLGGYVSLASEIVDPPKGRENEIVPSARLMENLHRGKKATFIAAGALFNLWIGFLFLIIPYGIINGRSNVTMSPTFTYYGLVYDNIQQKNSSDPIKFNDQIVEICNLNMQKVPTKINSFKDYQKWEAEYNKINPQTNQPPNLVLKFNSTKELKLDFTKMAQKRQEYQKNLNNQFFLGIVPIKEKLHFGKVIKYAMIDIFNFVYKTLDAFKNLVTFNIKQINGPVGIVKEIRYQIFNPYLKTSDTFGVYFYLLALLSVNLFIINLIPLPPLDGYKFFENAIEAIMRKKINDKFKFAVAAIGFIFLFCLTITTTIKDIFW